MKQKKVLLLLGSGYYVEGITQALQAVAPEIKLLTATQEGNQSRNNPDIFLQPGNELLQVSDFLHKNSYQLVACINRLDYYEQLHARICEMYSLPGPTEHAVRMLSDKVSMHQLMVEHDLAFYRPQSLTTSVEELEEVLANVQLPVVVKTKVGAKSRGVYPIRKQADIAVAIKGFQEIFSEIDHNYQTDETQRELLVEQFMYGKQVTPVSYVDAAGNYRIISLVDVATARDEGQKHMQLMYRSTPSKFGEQIRQKITYVMQELTRISGLRSTSLHPEFMVIGKHVYLIEVNVRIGGFRTTLMEQAHNINLNLLSVELALGYPVTANQLRKDASVTAAEVWEDSSGILRQLIPPKSKYIHSFTQHLQVGDGYQAPPLAHRPIATYFVVHPDSSLAVAKRIRKKLQVEIES